MNRDQLIDRAIRERRISAAQRDEFARMYDAQPAAIEHLLTAAVGEGGLMPGLAAAHETIDSTTAAYDPAWLNDRERAAVASREGSPMPQRQAPAPAPRSSRKRSPTAPAASAAAPANDSYDESWLTGSERSRRDAIKAGTFEHGPIQFEDAAAQAAARTAGAQ